MKTIIYLIAVIKMWVVALKLNKLSLPALLEKTLTIAGAMESNPYFPAMNPSATDLRNKVAAIQVQIGIAATGNKQAKANIRKLKRELIIMLNNEGFYVERVANDDPENGEAIILSADMNPKKSGTHTARTFFVKNSPLPGKMLLRTKAEKRASYLWEYSTDAANWFSGGITISAKNSISGLTSGTRYYFRVAVITKSGQGAWSDVLTIIVL